MEETYTRDLELAPYGKHEDRSVLPTTKGEHMRCQGRHCSIHSDRMRIPTHPHPIHLIRWR